MSGIRKRHPCQAQVLLLLIAMFTVLRFLSVTCEAEWLLLLRRGCGDAAVSEMVVVHAGSLGVCLLTMTSGRDWPVSCCQPGECMWL